MTVTTKYRISLGLLILANFAMGETLKSGVTELPKEEESKPHVEPGALANTVLKAVRTGASAGLCSPQVADAGEALKEIIFKKVGPAYLEGQIWANNDGVVNHFKDIRDRSKSFRDDIRKFTERIREIDHENPAKLGKHGPSLDAESPDLYQEALKITKGNVPRAVSLIGMLGHDDYQTGVPASSNLYAQNSVGVKVSKTVIDRFKEAGEKCNKAFPSGFDPKDVEVCSGWGSTFNYHMNFGFYLGCQLAMQGFTDVTVRSVFAHTTAKLAKDTFLEEDIKCRENDPKCKADLQSSILGKPLQYNVCTDLPKMLGHFYKKTTLHKWLTTDARWLYDNGYQTPFQAEAKSFKRPEGWSEERFKKAAANLDYRLMHLEYGRAMSETGAKRGEEVCREYVKKQMPKGLSKDAEALFLRGNRNANDATKDLKLPQDLKRSPARVEKAWNELKASLVAAGDKFDYGDAKPTRLTSAEVEEEEKALAKGEMKESLSADEKVKLFLGKEKAGGSDEGGALKSFGELEMKKKFLEELTKIDPEKLPKYKNPFSPSHGSSLESYIPKLPSKPAKPAFKICPKDIFGDDCKGKEIGAGCIASYDSKKIPGKCVVTVENDGCYCYTEK